MAAALISQPCAVLDSLAQFQYDVLRRLNRKFAALRRIAELLEQVGDLTVPVPNLAALLPITSINFDTYEQLARNCPFLNLPPEPTGENLNQLRQLVLDAYANLIRQLLNHPHLRLSKLQQTLARFQNDLNAGAAVISNYLLCLQTICDTVGAVGTAFANVSQAKIQKEEADYTKNFVALNGAIMTEQQKIKADQVRQTIAEIETLKTFD